MRTIGDGRLTVFGEHEQKVIDQMSRCLAMEDGSIGSLMPDGHFGYSAPIGGVVAYREHVSPAAVGYDIGCGNMAVATTVHADGAFKKALPDMMNRIFREVSFGLSFDGTVIDHPIFDEIAHAKFEPQRELLSTARKQLGTVGGGNHYVDLFEDAKTGRVWVGVHFGSRGFGHRTASGFLALARGDGFHDRVKEGQMEAPPDVLHTGSSLGWAYIEAMKLAGAYARAGREVVVQQVLDILGAQTFGEAVHNHHNFAWRERHFGEDFWVIRKGATPAYPGQKGFVGATMGEPAVILEGSWPSPSLASEAALFSTVHGAGRAMSRTAAAGKARKRWTCLNRDCDWWQGKDEPPPEPVTEQKMDGERRTGAMRCPRCKNKNVRKQWQTMTEGAINWREVVADLKAKGIELRGANAEEAPGAYKRLDEVLAATEGTVRVLHTLSPLGVAMAPGNVKDPYRD